MRKGVLSRENSRLSAAPLAAEVANRFRKTILSDGNSIDRAEAYRRFRGRDPEVSALLQERGLR